MFIKHNLNAVMLDEIKIMVLEVDGTITTVTMDAEVVTQLMTITIVP